MQATIPSISPATTPATRPVAINACLYRATHGLEPAGVGWWTFDLYAGGQCVERHWRYGGDYARALDAVRVRAATVGAALAELLP